MKPFIFLSAFAIGALSPLAAVGADAEVCYGDCPEDVEAETENTTDCASISVRGTDLASRMEAVWGPLAPAARQTGGSAAPLASRTGGTLKVRSAGNGPNGHPAFIFCNGAYGPVRIALTRIGPGATEAGRSGVGEAKSDDEGPPGLYVPRGAPTWYVGLGRDAAGQFAGQLELRAAALYSPTGALSAYSVEIHRDTASVLSLSRIGEIRQIVAKECRVEVEGSPTGGAVRVSFYRREEAGSAPFVEYAVSVDTNAPGRVVRVEEVRGGEVVSVREFFREEAAGRTVFGVSEGDGLRVRSLEVLSHSAASRTVLETVSGPRGAVARSTLRKYTVVG